jgi:hypothetical protein
VLIRARVAAKRLGGFHHDFIGIGRKNTQRFSDELIAGASQGCQCISHQGVR